MRIERKWQNFFPIISYAFSIFFLFLFWLFSLPHSQLIRQSRNNIVLVFFIDRFRCCCYWLMLDVRHQRYFDSNLCDFFCGKNEKNSSFAPLSPSLSSLSLPLFGTLFNVVADGWNILFYWLICVKRNSSHSFFLLFFGCILHHRQVHFKQRLSFHSHSNQQCRLKSSFDIWMTWEHSIYSKINFHVSTIRT